MGVVLAYANETQKPKEKPLPFPFVGSILDSSAKNEGGRAIKKTDPFRNSAAGVVSSANCSGLKVSPKILPKGIKIAEEGPISRNTQIIMPGKSLSPAECILNGLPKRPAESNAEKLVCTHVQKSHRFMFHGIDKAYSIRVSKTDRPRTRHDLGVGQAIPLRRNLPRECLRPVESETGNNWRPARGTDLQTRMILWERRQRIREPA